MRVLVVTTVHTPLDARIHHRQIRALAAAGWQVTYAAPWRATGTDHAEVVGGVACVDLPRAVGRRRLSALRAARRTVSVLGPDHDLVLLHDPELVLAVLGRLDRLPPVVLDVHEDLGASLPDRPWVPAVLRAPARALARRLEAWAEDRLCLLLAEEAYQERFTRPHPVVANLPWLPADPPPAGTHHRVVYVGRVSVGRGAHELVAVAARLHATGGPRLHLVGPVDSDVRPVVDAAVARGELTWHGFLPNDRALELVAGSVAGLSLLHDLPNYRHSRPTKLVEYLAHGVPAVTTPLPAAVALLEQAPGGIVVDFRDAAATVAAIEALVDEPERRVALGAAGRDGVRTHASWDAAAARFVAALDACRARATSTQVTP